MFRTGSEGSEQESIEQEWLEQEVNFDARMKQRDTIDCKSAATAFQTYQKMNQQDSSLLSRTKSLQLTRLGFCKIAYSPF